MSKTSTFIINFIFFLFASPFFLILIQNFPIIKNLGSETIFDHKQYYIDEINTLRGEANRNEFGILGRAVVNKYTIFTQESVKRYLHGFNPGFLFFNGGIDRFTSTGETGQLPLTFLPIILYGVYEIISHKEKWSKYILLMLFILPCFSGINYDIGALVPRIPLLILLVLIAVFGFRNLLSKNKTVAFLMVLLIFIESIFIYHKFANHYTHNIIEQKFSQ